MRAPDRARVTRQRRVVGRDARADGAPRGRAYLEVVIMAVPRPQELAQLRAVEGGRHLLLEPVHLALHLVRAHDATWRGALSVGEREGALAPLARPLGGSHPRRAAHARAAPVAERTNLLSSSTRRARKSEFDDASESRLRSSTDSSSCTPPPAAPPS